LKKAFNDKNLTDVLKSDPQKIWTTKLISEEIFGSGQASTLKATERIIKRSALFFPILNESFLVDEHKRPSIKSVCKQSIANAKKKRASVLFIQEFKNKEGNFILSANDAKGFRRWIRVEKESISEADLKKTINNILKNENKDTLLCPTGLIVKKFRTLNNNYFSFKNIKEEEIKLRIALEIFHHGKSDIKINTKNNKSKIQNVNKFTHLDRLEAESIHIFREVLAESENPAMLYSIGKDSSVMVHLARKAFYPSPPPFPLLHIDTQWKFQAMYDFRDFIRDESGMEMILHTNQEGVVKNINPIDHGSAIHTDIMKTQGLNQALEHHQFDVTFGGARRDEEKSRAKERIFSFRTKTHQWDPKNQRPELWNLYNGRKNAGESIRVFPISNWTELDIWQYIYRENIPIVPLYFSAERPVIMRDGMLIMVDDNRLDINANEEIKLEKIRFRSLGCYPLSGAILSDANDVSGIILELLSSKTSERFDRAIDNDSSSSMEKKKQEGYF